MSEFVPHLLFFVGGVVAQNYFDLFGRVARIIHPPASASDQALADIREALVKLAARP